MDSGEREEVPISSRFPGFCGLKTGSKWRVAPERSTEKFVLSRPSSSPEVFERYRAQLRVSRRVLDRSMAEPVLNAPRVMVGIGQGVAAGVP